MSAPIDSREELVHVFHAGLAMSFRRASKHSLSFYGGPMEVDIEWLEQRQRLHHVATLDREHLRPLGLPRPSWDVPLLYGFAYNDCRLQYTIDAGTVLNPAIDPREPIEDWPYADYPRLLPFVPLEPGPVAPSTWRDFVRHAPNLPEHPPAELVVLVPPPATLGFSMWGRWGDAEGVTLVFECSIREMSVCAYNVCS